MKKTNNSLSKWQSLLIQPLCQKKAREFKRAGYPKISRHDVEKYFTDFAWKHQLPASYRERKQAIKQLSINQYFDYLQLEATVYDVPSLDHIDIQSLLWCLNRLGESSAFLFWLAKAPSWKQGPNLCYDNFIKETRRWLMRRIGVLEFREPKIDPSRKILHVDMDAFYASIEQRDHPHLRGKPVIIAQHPKENSGKGVVATASYEARKFGVHSAMSASEAYRLCPQAYFVKGNKDYYRKVGEEVRDVFREYTDIIEPLSIDEAFLDVTNNHYQLLYAMDVAERIQKDIYHKLGLTCSIGVSYNKFIAKLASDFHKPHGMTIITPKRALAFLEELPIEKFYGIGKRTSEKMHELNIYKGKDLKQLSQEDCINYFGKAGIVLYERVRGVDDRPVKARTSRKSNGTETTLYPFLYHDDQVNEVLRHLAQKVANSLQDKNIQGQTVTLKFRYGNFETTTRQRALKDPINSYDDIYFHAQDLWEQYGDVSQGVRLLGITLSDLLTVDFENIRLPLY